MKKTAAQLSFEKVNGWGGKRRGAGRRNRAGRVNHMKRPKVKYSTPLHLTLRLKKDLVNLRCGDVELAFETAAIKAKAFGLRIVHYSLQNNHVHLIVEAGDNDMLARGMRSFGSCFGKAVRKIVGGKGGVFDGRFHLHVLKNPTEMRNALAYVLQNFSKHSKLLKHVDRYSSAPYFGDWRQLLGSRAGPILSAMGKPPPLPEHLSSPRSWLAQTGWMKAKVSRGVAPNHF